MRHPLNNILILFDHVFGRNTQQVKTATAHKFQHIFKTLFASPGLFHPAAVGHAGNMLQQAMVAFLYGRQKFVRHDRLLAGMSRYATDMSCLTWKKDSVKDEAVRYIPACCDTGMYGTKNACFPRRFFPSVKRREERHIVQPCGGRIVRPSLSRRTPCLISKASV